MSVRRHGGRRIVPEHAPHRPESTWIHSGSVLRGAQSETIDTPVAKFVRWALA